MGRCWGCCQENCGYNYCGCSCHEEDQKQSVMDKIAAPMSASKESNMSKDQRARLLHEWDHGKERFRLIATAKWSAGYEDDYRVEKLGADGLGEPRWDYHAQWTAKDTDVDSHVKTMLVGVIKQLLQEKS